MEYNFSDIEKKWQGIWKKNNVYGVENPATDAERAIPKCYVLDMFPYPSGAGLHVGHPLGYIASDIYARYKKLKGFRVLHPMGYDAFGLPAEQYAIEHGIHPAVSTANNIKNFRDQLDKIGFCFDWDRQVNTSEPGYYKWTQWIFLQLFKSFYNRSSKKAEPLETLVAAFEKEGNLSHPIPDTNFQLPATSNKQPTTNNQQPATFTAEEWKKFDEKTKQDILMEYRLAYCGYGEVNWCEALGTVLANDEVVNGVSERGGFPVVKKRLRQWYLRITEYADRLLEGLQKVDFSEAMKEMQTNWIGKSFGADIKFLIPNSPIPDSQFHLTVFTTRPDTIFGVDFMVIAPEHELVDTITTPEQKQAVEDYISYVKSRSERERMAEKKITGVFSGSYALHPFTGNKIPIWVSEYVLIGYGTGAIMAVPCGDQRDFQFANNFKIPITNIIGAHFNGEEANPTKDAVLGNSDFLNGMVMKDAIEIVIDKLENLGIGKRKVNYKMRDAAFSRQRYWGEPFPIVWKDGTAYPLDEKDLPLVLPEMDKIIPGKDGEGPLTNLKEWINSSSLGGGREGSTMPGYAGSSWYFLRYMDPYDEKTFCDRTISDYWNQVDLYVGGTEHAVGHLLYSRMWTKFLYDRGLIGFDEPYKKLMNQGMIQGSSRFVYRLSLSYSYTDDSPISVEFPQIFISNGLYEKYDELSNKFLTEEIYKALRRFGITKPNIYVSFNGRPQKIHIDVNIVDGFELNIDEFKKWRGDEYANAEFIKEDGKYICGTEVEKMSKSKLNTVNPDNIVAKYGADTFRMYEMFLGPVEMSKPWDTKGIEGVHRFLRKLWRLFYEDSTTGFELRSTSLREGQASEAELKVLHRTIKKIEEDTERFSFNTAVSTFMICVNELTDLGCYKKEILLPLLVLLQPYAPHIAEELYSQLEPGKALPSGKGISGESYPVFQAKYITETSKTYPVAINGKNRTELTLSLDADQAAVEALVLQNEVVKKWLEGRPPKRIIYVKNKMINVVV